MKSDSLDSAFAYARLHQVPSDRTRTKFAPLIKCSVCKEFSRIVCVSLFSYQGFCLRDSFYNLSHLQDFVNNFFQVFSTFLSQPKLKRRRRDLNPRAAINDLLPFQGSPFGQLGYFSKSPYLKGFSALVNHSSNIRYYITYHLCCQAFLSTFFKLIST